MVQACDPSNSSRGDGGITSLRPAWDSYLKKQTQKPKQLDRSCYMLERVGMVLPLRKLRQEYCSEFQAILGHILF